MSTIKLKEHPLFICISLCLFFPLGLIFLLRSPLNAGNKIWISVIGGMFFAGLLVMALLGRPNEPDPADFVLINTKSNLSIGQSGGFALYNEEQYYADFDTECSNAEILAVSGNLYTAKAAGSCILTVTFADQKRELEITVNDKNDTSETVYITPSGMRYHNNERHAGKTTYAVSEEDALMSSKTPCKICYKE